MKLADYKLAVKKARTEERAERCKSVPVASAKSRWNEVRAEREQRSKEKFIRRFKEMQNSPEWEAFRQDFSKHVNEYLGEDDYPIASDYGSTY